MLAVLFFESKRALLELGKKLYFTSTAAFVFEIFNF